MNDALQWLSDNRITIAVVAFLYVGLSLAKMPVPKGRLAYVAWWLVRWAAFLTHERFGGTLKVPFLPPAVEPPPFELPAVEVSPPALDVARMAALLASVEVRERETEPPKTPRTAGDER
jgi:hypothetical protein